MWAELIDGQSGPTEPLLQLEYELLVRGRGEPAVPRPPDRGRGREEGGEGVAGGRAAGRSAGCRVDRDPHGGGSRRSHGRGRPRDGVGAIAPCEVPFYELRPTGAAADARAGRHDHVGEGEAPLKGRPTAGGGRTERSGLPGSCALESASSPIRGVCHKSLRSGVAQMNRPALGRGRLAVAPSGCARRAGPGRRAAAKISGAGLLHWRGEAGPAGEAGSRRRAVSPRPAISPPRSTQDVEGLGRGQPSVCLCAGAQWLLGGYESAGREAQWLALTGAARARARRRCSC